MVTTAWVQMGLGTYRFSVFSAAYQRFSRRVGHRWARADRLFRAPAHEYLGPEAEEVEIEGVILSTFDYSVAAWAQLPLMRAQAATGLPLMLVDGLGFVWGRWCLTRVEETQSLFFFDGAPRRIDFRLSLAAYGEDLA